jgi:hypothetical protein
MACKRERKLKMTIDDLKKDIQMVGIDCLRYMMPDFKDEHKVNIENLYERLGTSPTQVSP